MSDERELSSATRAPRVLSERKTKWLLNLYPPLFFLRVRVIEVGEGCRSCRVRLRKSLLNRNLNGTIFGGAIFSAGDPYHAVLYWQVLGRLGRPVQVWLRQASIRYYKPAASDLMLDYALSDEDIEQACTALDRDGRFVRRFVTDAVDAEGDICAKIETEVYVRQLRRGQKSVSGF